MTTPAELSQKGNHTEKALRQPAMRAPGKVVVIAGNEKESKWLGGVENGVFHPVLVQWHSSDYQWCYVLGQGFHAATMVKRLWYAWPVPCRQQKSKGRAQQKKSKKAPKEALKPYVVIGCVCMRACVRACSHARSYVCVQSHPHAMIIHCVMYVCVFCAPSQSGEVWNRVSLLLSPPVLFPQIPLFSTSPSVSPPQPAPLHLSPRQWPCYRPFHTPPSMSVFFPLSPPFSSSSSLLFPPLSSLLSPPLIFPFSGAVLCN